MAMPKLFIKLLRDLSAARWQFAAMALVVLLGVASPSGLIMVSMSFFDAYQASMDLQLYRIRAYDAKVAFGKPTAETLANTVAHWEGVMLTFGTALGAAIVFKGVTISMLHRRREIATMRTHRLDLAAATKEWSL